MTKLNSQMWATLQNSLDEQVFLTANNPVIQGLKTGSLNSDQGIEILRQYYYLVVTIVQFLTIAMVRIPVERVKKELRRNLGEELGSRTNGRSHQEILEILLRKELGIESRTVWNQATQSFISGLLLDFNTRSPRFVAGMIYALEATACPELLVVADIINRAAQREVVDIAKLQDRNSVSDLKKQGVTTLQNFLAVHTLDFEIGHESGLRTTLEEFASENWDEFESGFNWVLSRMHIWWESLSQSD